ncbi:GNAT family N-acetyltransferase [Niallia sp. 01092]|uniref:GNAT family N-acetyltransferase n=1 Tax=unclassified Niallia TaxID=2837522 RepID=UPI003FD5F8D8
MENTQLKMEPQQEKVTMNQITRTKMKVTLSPVVFFPFIKKSAKIRTVRKSDQSVLSSLFYHGFKDNIDYKGETLIMYQKELKALLKGLFGPFLFDCSYLFIEKNHVVSASLVTLFQNVPVLMYAVTLPEHTNRGFFSQLLAHSMESLYKKGYKELYLVVTNGNDSAQYIYKKFGFQETAQGWKEIVDK